MWNYNKSLGSLYVMNKAVIIVFLSEKIYLASLSFCEKLILSKARRRKE